MNENNKQKRDQNYNFITTSLYFVRSGYIYLPVANGRLNSTGGNGRLWSSASTTKIWSIAGLGAYFFRIDVSDISPSNGPDYRWLGLPPSAWLE